MCGIVGYFGSGDARDIIIKGLEKLEYRGYDSSGIALINKKNKEINIYKDKGRVAHLKSLVDFDYETCFGIGHTRWATHGEPNQVNSHPHISMSKRFVIVHNGVIENVKKLKVEKLSKYSFLSDTDTEVIANLIDYYSEKMSVDEAIRKTLTLLEGSYALLVIDTQDTEKLYVAKNKTPILIGKGENGITIASDMMALVGYCDTYVSLEDKTFAIVTKDNYELYDLLRISKDKDEKALLFSSEEIEKGNYEHFMLKEIDEQPGVIRKLVQHYFYDDNTIKISDKIINDIKNSKRIYFVACGTSMHASYIGKYYFEKLVNKPVEVCIASELAYGSPFIEDNSYFIFLSQSGETADCIAVMKKCKLANRKTLAITNSEHSSMDNLADDTLNIHAGKEIAVASTKAYIAQVVVLSILAKACSCEKTNLKRNLNRVALAIEEIFNNKEVIRNLSIKIKNSKSAFYIGRGLDYYVALEAALKLKEISYIHTEGFASGELKHGTIALIEKGTPVIAIITQSHTNLITRSNLQETVSRGAVPIVISNVFCSSNDDDFIIPDVAHYLSPIVSVVVTQLISYYVSVMLGNDIDKPKNLAKSVTVE